MCTKFGFNSFSLSVNIGCERIRCLRLTDVHVSERVYLTSLVLTESPMNALKNGVNYMLILQNT